MYRYLKYIFFLYVITILFLATSKNNAGVDVGGDNVHHILAFVVFFILFYISFKIDYIYILINGMLFGALIESVQYFLPHRSCDLKDLVADLIGLIIGFLIVKIINCIV